MIRKSSKEKFNSSLDEVLISDAEVDEDDEKFSKSYTKSKLKITKNVFSIAIDQAENQNEYQVGVERPIPMYRRNFVLKVIVILLFAFITVSVVVIVLAVLLKRESDSPNFQRLRFTFDGDHGYDAHTKTIRTLIPLESIDNTTNHYLASGSDDSLIKIWEVSQGKLEQTLSGHKDSVHKIVELHKGYIASASYDQTVKVWNISNKNTSHLVFSFNHTLLVECLLFLDNLNLLASGSFDSSIKIWNLHDGSLKYNFDKNSSDGHTDYVLNLISLKNDLIASSSQDKTIKIWNITNGSLQQTFNQTNGGHQDAVKALISVNDSLIASGSLDTKIKIWNLPTEKLLITFDNQNGGHSTAISCLASIDNGDYLASGSFDGIIKIWDMKILKLKYTFNSLNGGHSLLINTLLSLKFDDLMASGSSDSTIKIWDDKYGIKKLSFDRNPDNPNGSGGHKGAVECLALVHNDYLASGSDDSSIKIWNI